MWDGTTLTSPNGGSIAINEKAKAGLEAAVKAAPRAPKAGDRFADAPRKGSDPNPPQQDNRPDDVMIWYADPAEYAHAYISISYEDSGEVLVRDGMGGPDLKFTREQWAALGGKEGVATLGEPEGDKKHPAAVRTPDELFKIDRTGKDS
jgi:hypothetical protein